MKTDKTPQNFAKGCRYEIIKNMPSKLSFNSVSLVTYRTRYSWSCYVDIFDLYTSAVHLLDFCNTKHLNLSFSIESESKDKISILDVEAFRENARLKTIINHISNFSCVKNHLIVFYQTQANLVCFATYRLHALKSLNIQFSIKN